MAITNNTELQAAIANWSNKTNLTDRIPEFITLAESRITDEISTSELHVTTTLTVDSASEALPTNYKGMVRIKLNGTYPPLDYMPPDTFHSTYAANQTGRPIAYTIEGNDILFGPSPDESYTATYTYKQKPDIATDSTNRLLTVNPNLYLFASLVEAFGYLKDVEMEDKYEFKYQVAKNGINGNDQEKGALAYQSDAP